MCARVAPGAAQRSTSVADDFAQSNSRPFPIARLERCVQEHAAYGEFGVFEKVLEVLGRVEYTQCVVRVGRQCE